MRELWVICPICDSHCTLLDTVDLNKNCEEVRGKFLPAAGLPVDYYLCGVCGFCYAPELCRWTPEQFRKDIYNAGYAEIDPDYQDVRPRTHANMLAQTFGGRVAGIRHLDYGGGNGLLSRMLGEAGWNSASYDPFAEPDKQLDDLGQFDLVTAFEVFEHVPDVQELIARLASVLKADGVVLFGTLLSDGNIRPGARLTWWYASPRNGHISLYSSTSLSFLAAAEGFNFGSFSQGFHAFWRSVPPWAAHVLPPR